MYRARYNQRVVIDPEKGGQTECRLKARFRFGKEVSRDERKRVVSRLDSLSSEYDEYRIKQYLKHKNIYATADTFGFLRLTVIASISGKRLSPEEMVDLKGIEHLC